MLTLSIPTIQPDLRWSEKDLAFFRENAVTSREDLLALLMKSSDPHQRDLVHQLLERQQVRYKLPSFYQQAELVYPPRLSLEQSSSECTAQFKASLFEGSRFIDLTAGMGIDSGYFARRFAEGILVEESSSLARITGHNLALLGCTNVKIAIGVDAAGFLRQFDGKADLIYLDPARRDEQGAKVVRLSDCEPDPIGLLPQLFDISDRVLIKTSPLLDIRSACEALTFVTDVYVVAVDNECKELLFLLRKGETGSPRIHAINLGKKITPEFMFTQEAEKELEPLLGDVKKYLYEPNAAIMKSGGFKSIGMQYDLLKLHQHTHLYTSDQLIPVFPGRCFEVYARSNVNKRDIKQYLPELQGNVSLRNFPGSVREFRKKMGIAEGSDQYLFVTTLRDESRVVLFCRKAQ